jgi:hypothetical protein
MAYRLNERSTVHDGTLVYNTDTDEQGKATRIHNHLNVTWQNGRSTLHPIDQFRRRKDAKDLEYLELAP